MILGVSLQTKNLGMKWPQCQYLETSVGQEPFECLFAPTATKPCFDCKGLELGNYDTLKNVTQVLPFTSNYDL